MKITNINNYIYNQTFKGLRGKTPTNSINIENINTDIPPKNKPTPMYTYYLYGNVVDPKIVNETISKSKPAPITDPILLNLAQIEKRKRNPFAKRMILIREKNTKKALDMEKIKSIILPQAKIDKLRSFEDSDKKFILDKYQKEAIDAFLSGKNTVVTAPTGTGKTLIAEYAIEDALKRGEKIIYLSPLKALSNEKFTKFSELFGTYDRNGNFLNSDNVGLLTGEITINPDADLLVMTTEIYRNLINAQDEKTTAMMFQEFSGVIYDEFHYLKDPERGTVWEESVMQTPKHMRQMMLSATASNAKEITNWIKTINQTKDTVLVDVAESERYIPLKEYAFSYDTSNEEFSIKPLYKRTIDFDYINTSSSDRLYEIIEELEQLYDGEDVIDILKPYADEKGHIDADEFAKILISQKGISQEKAQQISLILSNPKLTKRTDIKISSKAPKNISFSNLVKTLIDKKKTPALIFSFSKKKCQKKMDEVSKKLGTLLTAEESKKILDTIEEAKAQDIYFGEDFETEYMPKLLMGYAVHHAGMLPAYKSLVEKLSRQGLVKVCFATETLLAGINMPFKTTVFTSLDKFDGKKRVGITPTLFKQGAGRAGRRGIDEIGNVVICPINNHELTKYRNIIESNDTKIDSNFELSYATLLQDNVLNSIEEFIDKSFSVFNAASSTKIQQEINKKLSYLKAKKYIVNKDGKIITTPKGDIAKNIYGINQVLFCELITNPKYTKDLTPEELAVLMVIFADVKDDKPRTTFEEDMADIAEKLSPSIALAEKIIKEQTERKIDEEIKMSTNLAEAIYKFACSNNSREESIKAWNEIFDELKTKYIILHEGDLLRVFNSTIDLLRTIIEVSDNQELIDKAHSTINCLNKPPLTDILKYELNI